MALVGDAADGHPGLQGRGAKCAAAVLSRFGSLEAIPANPRDRHVSVSNPQSLSKTLNRKRDLALLFSGHRNAANRPSFKSVSGVPEIVLSAIAEVADKVLLLELGADDYVTKPFSSRELMARVQGAIRRRRKPVVEEVYRFGDCEIDSLKMRAYRSAKPVALTAHEFKLLRFFTEHAEQVLSREKLLNEVWGYNAYPTTRTADNQILKLRQKLEADAANPRHLQTIYGAGYRFIP